MKDLKTGHEPLSAVTTTDSPKGATLCKDAVGLPKGVYTNDDGELYSDNFSTYELRCNCDSCNKQAPHHIDVVALGKHQELRLILNRPYTPNSAFRCELHDDEKDKTKPGEHNRTAMDIPVSGGVQRGQVIEVALRLGAKGIGVYNTFVHVDFRDGELVIW